MARYRCKHCGAVMKRDSDKQWVKSYCGDTGRVVHLTRVPSRLKPTQSKAIAQGPAK